MKILWLGVALGLSLSVGQAAAPRRTAVAKILPAYTCACLLSQDNLNMAPNASGVISPPSFSLSPQPTEPACHSACASAAAPHLKSASVGAAACAAGAVHNQRVYAYYHFSGPPNPPRWVISYFIGEIARYPASTSTFDQCPAGWLANTSNFPGGITGDGRCKKLAGNLTIAPPPSDGTQLGSWGFSWGSEMWAYGSQANGGAALHIVQNNPAICKFRP